MCSVHLQLGSQGFDIKQKASRSTAPSSKAAECGQRVHPEHAGEEDWAGCIYIWRKTPNTAVWFTCNRTHTLAPLVMCNTQHMSDIGASTLWDGLSQWYKWTSFSGLPRPRWVIFMATHQLPETGGLNAQTSVRQFSCLHVHASYVILAAVAVAVERLRFAHRGKCISSVRMVLLIQA